MSDMDQSDVQAPPSDAVPVIARQPSSENVQEPAAQAVEEPISLEDAARVLLIYVKAHRVAGDADLEAAVADVEAALEAAPDQDAQ